MREDLDIVDMYAMEMIHNLILSLRVEGRTSMMRFKSVTTMTTKALRHMLKMFSNKKYAQKLSKVNESRTMYTEGVGEFVMWLYKQCSVPELDARRAAMETFKVVTESKTNVSSLSWLSKHVGTIFGSSEMALQNGPPSSTSFENGDETIEAWSAWYLNLAATIDLHHWLLSYDLKDRDVNLYSHTEIKNKKRGRVGDEKNTTRSTRSCLLVSLESFFDRSSSRFDSSSVSSSVSSVVSNTKREHISTLYISVLWRTLNFVNAALKTKKDSQIVSKLVKSESFVRTMFVSTLAPHLLLPCHHEERFLSNHVSDDFDRLTASCDRICKTISSNDFENTAARLLKSMIQNYDSLQLKFNSNLSIRGYQTLQQTGWLDRVGSLISSSSLVHDLVSIPAPSTPERRTAAKKLLRLMLTMGWPRALKEEKTKGSFLDCLLDSRDCETENDGIDDDSSKITCLGSRFYYHFRESYVEILSNTAETFRIALERATSAMFRVSSVKHISDIVFSLLRYASRRKDLIASAESSLQRLCLQWLPNGSKPDPSKWSDLTFLLRDMLLVSKTRVSLFCSSSVAIDAVVSLLRSESVSVEIKTQLLGIVESLLVSDNTTNKDELMGTIRNVVSQYFPMTSSSLDPNSEDARNYESILRAVRFFFLFH